MKFMTLTFFTITLFCGILQAPVMPADEQKTKIDLLFVNILKEKQQAEYNRELLRFADYLGYKESRNDILAVNTIGCFGVFQFRESTLKFLGYDKITLAEFKRDPDIFPYALQLDALKSLLNINSELLKPFESYIGKEINGTVITRSGLLAAAHLGGAGSVRKYLMTNGKTDKRDCYGTKISKYIKDFQGFNI
jgi:hypothetical protein